MPRIRPALLTVALAVIVAGVAVVRAQTSDALSQMLESRAASEGAPAEFQFARLAYRGNGMSGGRWGRREMWQTDWPDAEHHFSRGIDRLTRIDVALRGPGRTGAYYRINKPSLQSKRSLKIWIMVINV